MGNILIGGGTGLIGSALAERLTEKGHHVRMLSRDPKRQSKYERFFWDPSTGEIDENAFIDTDMIINLTGENISDKRWTDKQKQIIENSRVQSTNLLYTFIKKKDIKLKAFISASAIGYYGTYNSEKILTEDDPPGNDYLGKVGIEWENAATQIRQLGIPTKIVRIGVVFSTKGGAFPKLIQGLKYRALAVLGTGKQYVPWIHIDDLISLFIYLTEKTEISGIFNAVSPGHARFEDIIRQIRSQIEKKVFLTRIPSVFIKLLFGEMASILLYGTRISSEKIQRSGFNFKYKELGDALDDLL
jgi:uncharacterized protein (TIGR01777 family)